MIRSILLAVLAVATLGGCSSSPTAAFYTLSSDATLQRTDAPIPIDVVVGPVTVPELVDRPQMVTRVASNEVALNEFARWAEPLKSDIPRALAGDLSQLLGTESVSVFPQGNGAAGAYQVRVDVLHFDSTLGEAVTIDAFWAVRAPKQAVPLTGRTIARETVSDSQYSSLVAAHSRALGTVSQDIAAAIRRASGH
jgi:uncharacterized lipoprotein YmbA